MEEILQTIRDGDWNKIVFSAPREKEIPPRVTLRKIEGKSGAFWHAEEIRGTQAFHRSVSDPVRFAEEALPRYRETHLFGTEREIAFRISKKGRILRQESGIPAAKAPAGHDREKQYFIREGDRVPFLVELGIFTKEFKIVRSRYDKFRQINRFLELLDDALKTFPDEEISILDFGCGKSYLTFLVYYYFSVLQKKRVSIIGYDLKEDVVAHCNELARSYGYNGLSFVVADVTRDALTDRRIDLVLSLHACDVATDYALDYAIRRDVPYIFSVPCCQHEVNAAIRPGEGDLDLLLEHGLFRERTSALITDAFRTSILEAKGYRVDVLEFVDFSHSPKNVMLRAKKVRKATNDFRRLYELEERYGFRQTLLHLQES